VDDYESLLRHPFTHPETKKTKVKTVLLTTEQLDQSLEELGRVFGVSLNWHLKEEYEENEVLSEQHFALTEAARKREQEKRFFNFGKPFFTYIFIAIQVIMFVLLELRGGSTNSETLIRFGAKFNPLILEGEWWRLFTPIFLHIGFLHLAMNTLALYYLGTSVERIYGRVRFFFIYIFSGFTGAAASFVMTPNLSAGASGAIFGCFGALLYFGFVNPKLFFRTMGMNVLVVIAFNLIFGFTVPGIDNAGHIGGLIGGFLATGVVHFPKKKKWAMQAIFLAAASIFTIGLLYIGFHKGYAGMDANAVNVMAQQYIKQGEYDQADQLLNEFIEGNESGTAETYFFLAFVELKQQQYEEARQHLHQAIEKRDDFHEAHFNLALVYYQQGDRVQALQYAENALRLQPSETNYRELVQELTD
ncbi:MAG TPA: rhomboid family intramembrane serine protease, partial [Chondromyces sp.]|nr:rhomboid family intramembrane serine protease [Chondromyces sp.]